MWQCPPASGTPFIGPPRAKKKPRGPTEEGRPKQNFLVYPRTSPHRQADAIMSAASSTLERDPERIDAKVPDDLRLAFDRVRHRDDDALGPRHQIHRAAHARHHTPRNHPVGQPPLLIDLKAAQHGDIDMATADETKRHSAVEGRRSG